MTLHSLIIALTFGGFATAPAQSTWPQWRGLTRDGQVRGVEWPEQLHASQLRQVWRVELGPSYSGPIVAGDRVFTTETKDRTFEVVTAQDRKGLWKQPIKAFRCQLAVTTIAFWLNEAYQLAVSEQAG